MLSYNRNQPLTLTLGHLYPDQLNLYGDRGNILTFRPGLRWLRDSCAPAQAEKTPERPAFAVLFPIFLAL